MRVLLHKAGALESVALSLIIQKPASLLPGIYIKDGCQDTQYQVHSVVSTNVHGTRAGAKTMFVNLSYDISLIITKISRLALRHRVNGPFYISSSKSRTVA